MTLIFTGSATFVDNRPHNFDKNGTEKNQALQRLVQFVMGDEIVPHAGVVCRSHHDKLTYLLRYVSTPSCQCMLSNFAIISQLLATTITHSCPQELVIVVIIVIQINMLCYDSLLIDTKDMGH